MNYNKMFIRISCSRRTLPGRVCIHISYSSCSFSSVLSLLQNPTAPTSNFSPQGKILSCFRRQHTRVSHITSNLIYPSLPFSLFLTTYCTSKYLPLLPCWPFSFAAVVIFPSFLSPSFLICFSCASLHLFASLFQVDYCLHSVFNMYSTHTVWVSLLLSNLSFSLAAS